MIDLIKDSPPIERRKRKKAQHPVEFKPKAYISRGKSSFSTFVPQVVDQKIEANPVSSLTVHSGSFLYM